MKTSNLLRKKILDIIYKSRASHVASAFSVIEILLAIYKSVDIDKIKNKQNDRDRVILSKGHAVAALYVILNHFGLMDDRELETYYANYSLLGGHVTHQVPYIEHSTGALGHGLPVATGIAVGLKSKKINSRVYAVLGDGELQEGSNWEALMLAGHHKLNNLHVLIDYNKLGCTYEHKDFCNMEPLKEKLESFGFETFETDGHNEEEIYRILQDTKEAERSVAVICHTVKGKGVSFMENNNDWHSKSPNKEEYERAVSELLENNQLK